MTIPPASSTSNLIAAAERLRHRVGGLQFAPPVSHVYNPLEYAWRAHEQFLGAYGRGRKSVVFLGMNPGPFGMVQTGASLLARSGPGEQTGPVGNHKRDWSAHPQPS